jgi:PAS domain S-box-containing protein
MILSLHPLDAFADRFLPPGDSRRPDERRREQMFVIAHLASPLCVAILAAMLYALAGVDTPPFFGLAFGFATFYAYPFLLKRIFSFRTASFLSTAQFTVLIFLAVYFFGGWSSFALPWFASLPMAGMLFLGFRGAYTTSALALSGLLALLALTLLGHSFSNPLPGAWQSPMMMASIALCIAFNTGIAFLHVRLHSLSHSQLRKREALSVQIQKMAALGSWEIDYDANFVTWSDEVYRIVGLDRSEYDGRPGTYLQYVHPEDREKIAQATRELKTGKDLEYIYRLVRPDGDVRIVHVEAIVTRAVGGIAQHARGFMQDITRREKSEDALRASEFRMSEVQEIANVGSWDLHIDRDQPDKTHWSAGLCRIYGIEEDAFPTDFETYLTYVHEEDRDRARREWIEAFESDIPLADEYRIVRPNGVVRHIVMQARLLQNQRLGAKHWIGTTTDVTEHKQMEASLRESEARYREIFENAPIALWVEDWSRVRVLIDRLIDEGVEDIRAYFAEDRDRVVAAYDLVEVVQTSKASLDLYGAMKAEDYVGASRGVLVLPEELDAFLVVLFGFMEGRWRLDIESLDAKMDGTEIMVRTRGIVPLAHRHDWSRLIYSKEDITKRTETDAALKSSMEQTVVANRTMSEFLAHMSHELRTPLNAIIGFSDVMKGQMFGAIGNPKYLEYAKDINESGTHLLGIISDILDLSKIESGKTELHERYVHVTKTLESCLTLVKERAQDANVGIKYDTSPDMPELYVDELKFKQILINILSNAINFTPTGGTITMNIQHCKNSGFAIQIIDTGIGIAPEDIPRALTPFQQIDSGLNGKNQGTGLGLPLSKILVELHGGSLDIKSEVGIGTTVTVRFPAERVAPESASVSMAEKGYPRLVVN